MVIVSLAFLVTFPLAIGWLWNAPRSVAALYFLIPFTCLFCVAVPFLWRKLRGARTRIITLAGSGNTITIGEKSLFGQSGKEVDVSAIRGLVFETSDNDGLWHRGLIELETGEVLPFVQGSSEAAVRDEFNRLAAELAQHSLAIPSTNVAV